MKTLLLISIFTLYGCKANFNAALKAKAQIIQQIGVDGFFRDSVIACVIVFLAAIIIVQFNEKKRRTI